MSFGGIISPSGCPRCGVIDPHKHYSGQHVSYAHDPLDSKSIETEEKIERVKDRIIRASEMGITLH